MVESRKGGERNEKVTVELHLAEYKMICALREIEFGSITVTVRAGVPQYADKVIQKIKFI